MAWNVRFLRRSLFHQLAPLARSLEQIKTVHPAAVRRRCDARRIVRDTKVEEVAGMCQCYPRIRAKRRQGIAISSRESTEIAVEAPILLNDEDDVVGALFRCCRWQVLQLSATARSNSAGEKHDEAPGKVPLTPHVRGPRATNLIVCGARCVHMSARACSHVLQTILVVMLC